MRRVLRLTGLFTILLFTVSTQSACSGCSAENARLTQGINTSTNPQPGELQSPDEVMDLSPGAFAACTKAADCDDANPCTDDACVEQLCTSTPLPIDLCCHVTPLQAESFDTLTPEALDADSPMGGAGWTLGYQRAVSAPASLYFGDAETLTMGAAQRVIGAVRMPPVTLPDGVDSRLTMRLFVDIEAAIHRDQLQVIADILDADGSVTDVHVLMTKVDIPEAAYAGFSLIDLSLLELAGQTIRVRLDFDSVEAPNPGSEGVFIDDIEVTTICPDALPEDVTGQLEGDTSVTDVPGEGDASGDDEPSDGEDGANTSGTQIVSGGSSDPCDAPDAHAGCCTSDDDCDDGNPATVNVCEGAECVAGWNPDVCTSDEACDDGEPCTIDVCTDTICTHEGTFGTACCEEGVRSLADFDTESLQGIFVTDNLETGVFWRTDPTRATSGEFSLYCGEPVAQTYGVGTRVKSSATTPVIDLPVGGHTRLTFDLFMVTRQALDVDVFQIFVLKSGALTPVWSSKVLPAGNTTGFMPIQVDLSSFAGQSVQLRFVFDSVDAHAPSAEGTYIDSLRLETTCL